MFTVYSKVNCKYCEAIEKIFLLKEIDYKKNVLHIDYTKEDFINKFGDNGTFPKILNENGDLIGGVKETVNYLMNNNLV